jgi:hypothetical protein
MEKDWGASSCRRASARSSSRQFGPLQRGMLSACLQQNTAIVNELDPSRNPRALETYRDLVDWFEAGDDRVRWTHDSIGPRFRNGGHQGQDTDKLVQELVDGEKWPQALPALVCVLWKGNYWVVFGNRRLNAYRQCARRCRSDVWCKTGLMLNSACGFQSVCFYFVFRLVFNSESVRLNVFGSYFGVRL